MKNRKLTILVIMLTIILWAARPVALADGIEWLTPDPGEPEQGEELSPAAAPEMDWLTPDETPEAMTPAGVSTPDEPEWLTQEEEQVIDVTVPGIGELMINPYRLPVEINGETVRDQIINCGQVLTSHSTVPIVVSATLTVNTEQSNGLTITPQHIASEEREKLGYLYVEFQNLPDREAAANWSGEYTGAANQLLASDGAAATGEVLQIGAGNDAPSYAAYRLFGELSENPETGWQSGDKLSVTVSFTFRPAEGAEPSPAQTEPEAALEPDPQSEPEEVPDRDLKTIAIPISEPTLGNDPDYGPEPEPNYELTQEEPQEPEADKVESFASGSNPDWMLPPDESRKER